MEGQVARLERELDAARQLASLREVRIRELELQIEEAAVLCERNAAELDRMKAAVATLLQSLSVAA